MRRIRFAPPCTAAASASSGVRWPRVGPSAVLDWSVASQTSRSASRELAERVARPAVAGVGEHAVALDAEGVCLHVVVNDREGGDAEAGRRERDARLVLRHVEGPVEHVLAPEAREQGRSSSRAPGGSQSSTRRLRAGAVQAAPDPRDQITPVV